jgi:hypothetical protein
LYGSGPFLHGSGSLLYESDTLKSDTLKSDPLKSDPLKSDTLKSDPLKSDTLKSDALFFYIFFFAKVAEGHQPSAGARKVAPVRARPFLVILYC